ncbi:Uncharacterised protein [Wolbachia endosymbiont wPip_Mol of Culex molestus]|nr:Uncharacterised protein [Wolbachia endosymbiont wPip_Mol of Culex molestus]
MHSSRARGENKQCITESSGEGSPMETSARGRKIRKYKRAEC